MRVPTIPFAALLLLPACGASDEEQVETAIRQGLAERGTVLDVQVTREGDDPMTGVAILRNHAGTQVRMNCTVEREGEKSVMKQGFSWRCEPA